MNWIDLGLIRTSSPKIKSDHNQNRNKTNQPHFLYQSSDHMRKYSGKNHRQLHSILIMITTP